MYYYYNFWSIEREREDICIHVLDACIHGYIPILSLEGVIGLIFKYVFKYVLRREGADGAIGGSEVQNV